MKVLYLLDNPEEVLPIMAYTGRLRPKGIPFFFRLQVYQTAALDSCSWTHMKGKFFHLLKHMKGKGNLSFWYAKKVQKG